MSRNLELASSSTHNCRNNTDCPDDQVLRQITGVEEVDMGDIVVIISLIKIAMLITDVRATWITLTSGRYGSSGWVRGWGGTGRSGGHV